MLKLFSFRVFVLSIGVTTLFLQACSTPNQIKSPYDRTQKENSEIHVDSKKESTPSRGIASWYGRRFHKRRTASGERYNMYDMTAAHRTLPFGARIRVKSLDSGKTVIVRINDRGPYRKNRLIDLSYAAFRALGYARSGLAPVELEIL
jgi:rare lipoprotein A